MSNKIIGLSQLQEFKTKADLKYQDKLTAGSNISITNDVISATVSTPTYVAVKDSGSNTISASTITNLGSVVLLPGKYFLVYSCYFNSVSVSDSSYAQCGFSTNTTDITGFGRGWGDNRYRAAYQSIQTRVSGIIEVSATDYPNGRTFYMLARYNSISGATTCYPRCFYIKF